jgi:hypothetical protein
MQHELKFRAWDNIDKRWLLGYDECGGFSLVGECMLMGEWSAILSDVLHGKFGENGEELKIQQYTGLKDNAGDIIKYPPLDEFDGVHFKYFQVIWDDFFKSWALANDSGQPLSHTGWKFYNCDMGEVWGNIFENPELLKN